MMSINDPLSARADIGRELQVQLTFDPSINDMAIRIQEIHRTIVFIDDDPDMSPDLKFGLIDNLTEENIFCRNKLQELWDSIPDPKATQDVASAHPNLIEQEYENDPFTEVIVIDETVKKTPEKKPKRKAAKK